MKEANGKADGKQALQKATFEVRNEGSLVLTAIQVQVNSKATSAHKPTPETSFRSPAVGDQQQVSKHQLARVPGRLREPQVPKDLHPLAGQLTVSFPPLCFAQSDLGRGPAG